MAVKQINSSDGRELRSNPGFVLRKDAAQAWERAIAAFGKRVIITGAWRSRETQERLFDRVKYPSTGRYLPGARSPYGDYRTYKGKVWGRVTGAAAAVPGTSNHGGGVAVDVKTRRDPSDPPHSYAVFFRSWNDSDRAKFLMRAKEHGWDDDEGRSVKELWHITYYPEKDQHRGEEVPGSGSSKPTPRPEPTAAALAKNRTKRVQAFLGADVDGIWGSDTEKHVNALRAASNFGGRKFPHGVKFAQLVVKASPRDGKWGPASEARHTATVRAIQDVLSLRADGIYGPKTDEALERLERATRRG